MAFNATVDVAPPPGVIDTTEGFRVTVKPRGSCPGVKLTLPLNPFVPRIVIVKELDDPAGMERESALADTSKSTILTVTKTLWEMDPLSPVKAML